MQIHLLQINRPFVILILKFHLLQNIELNSKINMKTILFKNRRDSFLPCEKFLDGYIPNNSSLHTINENFTPNKKIIKCQHAKS